MMFKRWMVVSGLAVALALPAMGYAQDKDQGKEPDRQSRIAQAEKDRDQAEERGNDRDKDRDQGRDRDREERGRDRDDEHDQNKVTVSLTAPANHTVVTAPGTVTLTADASVSRRNWAVERVEYYQGASLIGSATAAPYSVNWSNIPAGNYTLTAKAIATNRGQGKDRDKDHRNSPTWEAVSAPVGLTVNAPPTVSLASPTTNQSYIAPAGVTVTANATDSDGTVAKVEFYQGATLIGTATAAPYSVTWQNVPAGSYMITAKATDDKGAITASAPVQIIVNAPPTVSLTSPTASQSYIAPASVTITADATDSDGSITKMEFYQGATLIGTATAAPYTVTWANAPAGNYTITAKATDDRGAAITSAPVQIVVDAPPTVSLTSPITSQAYVAPASVTVTADAADADGTVSKVEFYQGTTLIGTATAAPYSATWQNAPAGTYTLTAKATDDRGATTTSAPIQIIVNAPPTVSLTGPATGQVYIAPASVTITADAADSDGTITKVEFYQGSTLIGTATAAPYSVTWQNAPAGTYTLTAKATDNQGAVTTTAALTLTVIPNQLPSITLTTPTAGQRFTAPATLNLAASAQDVDGQIARVEYYQGTTLIGTATAAPYAATWQNIPEGQYSLTAKAIDNGGGETYSSAVSISVGPAGMKIYYLHSDHLNTPRVVTDEQNRIVWRNTPLGEPFGNAVPEQDPDGDGVPFTLNLRFPGQYFDKETNLNYNYFRDYDPQVGRYIQSDLIGLKGGNNTFIYTMNEPLLFSDPLGLVKWSGSQTSISAGLGGGAVRFKFKLYSDCVNGKKGYAEVVAGGFAVGVGVEVSGTSSSVEFEDDMSTVDPFVFEGWSKYVSVSWAAGTMGYGWQAVQLGGARSVGGGFQMGWDASISGGAGISNVVASKVEACGCGK